MHRLWLAAILCIPASSAVAAGPHSPNASAAYQLHMKIEATVSGRRYLFFSFKGMLLAEATLNLTSSPTPAGGESFSLRDVADKNFMMMSVNRKANEFHARCAARSIEEALGVGRGVIAQWAGEYPAWSDDVRPDRQKTLPFLIDPVVPGPRFVFAYVDGMITAPDSTLHARYAWPAESTPELSIFEGLAAALSLFNHSPFPGAAEPAAFERTFHVAPQLREICMAILPQAKSELEFTELVPVVLTYRSEDPPAAGLQRLAGGIAMHRQVERSFWLECYQREAVRSAKSHRLESDRIRILLVGTSGNEIHFEIVLRRQN